ncbi:MULTISPECIES: LamG-like jellyroll fold domain-containing protein [Nonomuraea]|uniref:LamG-like jellyroll fold domain-containing protein n=1 Tax=Nonomuraea mangrovi TaxID=2316207 RepID=A0ABW4SUS4_9ACTN
MDAAKAEAQRTEKEVEIPSLHTENMTTVAMPGGKTVRTYVSSSIVRVHRDGAWHKVDPTLVVENGVVKPRMTKLDLRLSNGGSDVPLLTAKGDSLGVKEGQPGEIRIAAPGKLPVPELSGNTATYSSAYGRNVDLVVIATPEGYQHQIVIRERPGKPLKLPVPIDPPSGMRLGKSSGGKPAALADGKKVADLSTLPVLDAKAMAAPGTGKAGTATAALTGSGDNSSLVLTPDATFLADPAVTYPVTVAAGNPTPWHGAGAPDDTFIANGGNYVNGSYSANSAALFAGRRDGYNYRSYLKFNLSGAPFFGRQILDANIILWNYLSHQCGSNVGDISMHRIASSWTVNTLTWSNQPLAVADGHVINPHGLDQSCSGWMDEGELWYSIEEITQAWADGQPNHGVMIRAVGESGANNWRQYLSGNWAGGSDGSHHPYFFVEYEAPDPSIGAVGWFAPDEAGMENRADIERYAANPSAVGATDAEPVVPSLSDVEAIEARDTVGHADTELPVIDAIEEDPDDPSPDPDALAPAVISTEPNASATSVPRNTAIRVKFSEATTEAHIVVKDSAGANVATQSSTQDNGRIRIETPLSILAPSATYTVEVSGAKDAAGNTMTVPHQWSFMTSAAVSTMGLVAAYGLNEASGASVPDSSGNGNSGTMSGASWVPGKYGRGLSFSGLSESWVTVGASDSLKLSQGMTLSAWVNPTDLSSYRTVAMKDHTAGSAYGLYASNGEKPSAWMLSGGASEHHIVNGGSTLPLNSWSHLAVTYDGAISRLYVNGLEAGQLTMSGNLADDGGDLHIGGNTRWGEFFNGIIDEVRIYDRAQTSDEIQADMNIPVSTPTQASTSLNTAATLAGIPEAENVPPKAGGAFERMTPQKCAEQRALAGRGVGWVMNHYSWCQIGKVVAAVDHGLQFERYMADVMLIGYTFTGVGGRDRSKGETSRDLVVEAYVYNHNVYGTMPPTKTMVLKMGIGNNPRCESVSTWNGQPWSNQKQALISSWVANGRATFRFKCDPAKASEKRPIRWQEPNAQGNTWEEVDNLEKVSNGTFQAWVDFPDWPNTRGYRYVMANKDIQGFKGNIIRCDTAEYIKAIGGCTFYLTKPAIKWSYTAQASKRLLEMKQAYQHYWNACTDPDGETWPDNPDKLIRGCDVPGSSIPYDHLYMQRVAKAEADSNHTKTTPICKSMFGEYPSLGKECDEFPFASTRERTNGPNTKKWSFCPIIAKHNSDAGLALEAFYQKDRVLTGDLFSNRFDQKYDEPISREDLCGESAY